MIVPDTNLLLYAHISSFEAHPPANAWWTAALNGREEVGLTPPVVFAFIRIVTHRRILSPPIDVTDAIAITEGWFARENVSLLTPGPRHLELAFGFLRSLGTASDLTTDAQIAAFAAEQRATVYSNDTDFARFPGLRVVNPILG